MTILVSQVLADPLVPRATPEVLAARASPDRLVPHAGPTGDRGDSGLVGPQGHTGTTGPTGPSGKLFKVHTSTKVVRVDKRNVCFYDVLSSFICDHITRSDGFAKVIPQGTISGKRLGGKHGQIKSRSGLGSRLPRHMA